MPKHFITLTPLEPWFFGTDRTLKHPDRTLQRDGGYFIQSADTPSQTTLFGALRYLGIEKPSADFSLSDDDKARIGKETFQLGKAEQDFGKINKISPLYLLDDENRLYVPTPFDHDGSSGKYSPFDGKSYVSVQTNLGERLLPKSYNEKNGIASGWMCLDDEMIHDDLFQSVTGIGIDKQNSEEAFFKRARKIFDPEKSPKGMRFAFFANADFEIPERVVYLGQQKSAFLARTENLMPPSMAFVSENIAYAQSDLYIEDPYTLYDACKCAITKLIATRSFVTNYGADAARRYSTRHNLLHLIQAGSVFWVNDAETFKTAIKNNHAAIAGFNKIIIGGKTL